MGGRAGHGTLRCARKRTALPDRLPGRLLAGASSSTSAATASPCASGCAPARPCSNCFAYTCAFSVAAAAGGARTTSVDLSRRSLDWGRENFRLNDLDPAAGHEFFAGDVFDHLRRFGKQRRRFDAVLLDPPTFSRDRKGRVFRVEDDFGTLAALAVPLLAPGGVLLCSSNARTFTATGFRRMILSALPKTPGGWQLDPAPMPPDFTGEHYLQAGWFRQATP